MVVLVMLAVIPLWAVLLVALWRRSPHRECPSRAFLLSRKKPDCVTHVSGMNCHPLSGRVV